MLMLVTRSDARLPAIVRAAVDGGVNMVQIRGEADVDSICAVVGDRARVVVNSARGRLAGWPGAVPAPLHGIHLTETAPFANAPFVGRSVHSVDAAVRAEQEGCDYVVAGSVFPTTSHPNGPIAGVKLIEDVARAVSIPVLAIGGINATNARSCIDAGARGVAVISAIFDAEDPKQAAQELWRAIA